MNATDDKKYMQMALDLANKGRGKTSPNPMVGAVIVKNNKILGFGYHKKAGSPHAEINAIKNAKGKVSGATLYVNLEPCCHHGRTGPCTSAVIENKIKRVVIAQKDPNKLVAGKGIKALRKSGIEVTAGVLRKEAESLNEVYNKYIATGLPFVILKTAQTLDGKIATLNGDSKWITNQKSRKFVHQMRAEYDAVLVGAATVRADNPALTVRHVKGDNPYRIVLTGNPHSCSKSFKFIKDNQDRKSIVATSERAASMLRMKGLIVWSIKKLRDGLSLDDLLVKAGEFGITSIMLEGGSVLAGEFLEMGLIDKHYAFIAPKVMGEGRDVFGGIEINKMSECFEYESVSIVDDFHPDMLMIGYPKKKSSSKRKNK